MSPSTSAPELLQHILFCTDFSENADFAFDFAIDAASRRPDSTLYLLHVIPETEAQFWKSYIYEVDNIDEKAKHDIDDRIAASYLPRIPQGMNFKVEFVVGKDSITILEFACKHDIDLIVMGREGKSALGKTFFGNVTEKVVRKADCAVLVIPLSFEKKHLNSAQPPE